MLRPLKLKHLYSPSGPMHISFRSCFSSNIFFISYLPEPVLALFVHASPEQYTPSRFLFLCRSSAKSTKDFSPPRGGHTKGGAHGAVPSHCIRSAIMRESKISAY